MFCMCVSAYVAPRRELGDVPQPVTGFEGTKQAARRQLVLRVDAACGRVLLRLRVCSPTSSNGDAKAATDLRPPNPPGLTEQGRALSLGHPPIPAQPGRKLRVRTGQQPKLLKRPTPKAHAPEPAPPSCHNRATLRPHRHIRSGRGPHPPHQHRRSITSNLRHQPTQLTPQPLGVLHPGQLATQLLN